MTTRAWTYPDLRNGTTIHHVTDTHMGAAGGAAWLKAWMDRIRDDILDLSESCHGHVHTGDCIHWDQGGDQPSEDVQYVAWRTAILADGLPYSSSVGNHDLDCFAANAPDAHRTAKQWASAVGIPAANNRTDIGEVRVISIGPDDLPDNQGWLFSDATLSYLDTQLGATTKPCFVSFHCPPSGQYGGTTPGIWNPDYRNPTLFPIMDSHPNCVGMLHGHSHANIDVTNHARTLNIGSRQIFSINGPPCGGGRYSTVAYADHQWQSPAQSIYLTYLGDAVVVRWRDHLRRQWTTGAGALSRTILLPANPANLAGYGNAPYGIAPYGGIAS